MNISKYNLESEIRWCNNNCTPRKFNIATIAFSGADTEFCIAGSTFLAISSQTEKHITFLLNSAPALAKTC